MFFLSPICMFHCCRHSEIKFILNHYCEMPTNQSSTKYFFLPARHMQNGDKNCCSATLSLTWRPLLLLVCLVVQFSRFTISSWSTSSIWLWCSSRWSSPVSSSSALHSDAKWPFLSLLQNKRNHSINNWVYKIIQHWQLNTEIPSKNTNIIQPYTVLITATQCVNC